MKYITITIILLFTSCSFHEDRTEKKIIPISKAVGSGEILNLSDYAKSVKYIPLKTTDSILIGRLTNAIPIGNKYLIGDAPLGYTSKYYLFDEEGNYVIPIGSIGHGPGQYNSIRSVDTDNKNKTILLETIPKCFEYNWDGVLIDEKIKMDSAGYYPFQTMYAGKNLYLSTISSPETREYKAFLYEKEETGLKIIRTYLNYFQREKTGISKGSWGTTDGKIFRGKDQIRYWRAWDDTIFTFNAKQDLEVAYVFDYGKYKAPTEWMFSYRTDQAMVYHIFPEIIMESKNYLFFKFSFGNNAPEKFEYEQRSLNQGSWQTRKRMNVTVCSIFDKNTGKLILLNQPVKHKYLGFRNDLDGGPCFWPKYISAEDEMVTWWTADEFLDIYGQLSNPSAELKSIAEKLNSDDNPVLMVVKLK